MSTNVTSQSPFLRTSRNFPQDPQALSVEVNKSYVDIANFVNARTIGIYATNRPTITGNQWFLNGPVQKQQTLRQIYPFSKAGNIPHGINLSLITGFTNISGTFTDGTNWYPLPYVDVVAADNQINIVIGPSNIVITAGSGAPSIVSGYVILEWLVAS